MSNIVDLVQTIEKEPLRVSDYVAANVAEMTGVRSLRFASDFSRRTTDSASLATSLGPGPTPAAAASRSRARPATPAAPATWGG